MSPRDRSGRTDLATRGTGGDGVPSEDIARAREAAGDGPAPAGPDDLPDLQSDLLPDPPPVPRVDGDAIDAADADFETGLDRWSDPAAETATRRGWRGIRRADGLVSSLRLLAELALDPLLTPGLRRALRAGEPIVVAVAVPGPAWVAPVDGVIAAASGGQARRLTQASRPRASAARDPDREAVDLLAEGRPVVAIAPDAAWLAPTLAAAADHALTVPPLDARLVTRAIAIWCGRRPRRAIAPEDLAGLDLLDVAGALRPGSSPGACAARLRRASRARLGPAQGGAAPPLAELAGYGPAHGWATALVSDIARVRRGEMRASLLEGAVLFGIPGTGKTTFARALAAEAGVPFVTTSVAEWFTGSSGHLDGVVKSAASFFDALGVAAKANGTAVGFLDELDALPNRSRLSDRGADWWLPVITFVLLRVEEVRRAGVVLLAATNDLSRVDAALLRPGRFDRQFEIGPPDADARLAILRVHLGDDLRDADLAPAIRLSEGATGAVLAGYVRAARRRAQGEGRALALGDLLAELTPADPRPIEQRRAVALHEAGHALVAHRLGQDVVEVTLRVGPRHEGVTVIRFRDPTPDRAALERRVLGLLAGRAADVRLGVGAHAGASADLSAATALLAAVHASFGLGGRLSARVEQAGALALMRADPPLADLVEADLRRLEAEAARRVWADRAAIRALAEALLAEPVQTGAEVAAIAAAHPPRVRVPAGRRPYPPGPAPDPADAARHPVPPVPGGTRLPPTA
ncbi:AAA family ATPase [Methylobacterium brachiatum]|uniref:AAA family ATPase n=2 Tax=Methylobacterium brachiatum TaxID=269660 RepID=A0ABV1RB07_9HYPH